MAEARTISQFKSKLAGGDVGNVGADGVPMAC